jgi:LPXTG-motif cell wall-anchored protein
VSRLVSIDENTSVTVSVVTADGESILSQTFHRDCQQPAPSLGTTNECAEGGIEFSLINDGDDIADFTVNDASVPVGARSTVKHLVAATEGQTVSVTVTANDAQLYYGTITRDCEEAETPPPPNDPPPPPPAEITPPPTTVPPPPATPPAVRSAPVTPIAKVAPAPAPTAVAAPLARTGSSSSTSGLLLSGLGLVTLGGLLVAGGRRRRATV